MNTDDIPVFGIILYLNVHSIKQKLQNRECVKSNAFGEPWIYTSKTTGNTFHLIKLPDSFDEVSGFKIYTHQFGRVAVVYVNDEQEMTVEQKMIGNEISQLLTNRNVRIFIEFND